MSELDKYDSTSERLDNASFEDRLIKFAKIFNGLEKENIKVVNVCGSIDLEDETCGFKLTHNSITWEVYRVVDVIDMIVNARNSYIERTT